MTTENEQIIVTNEPEASSNPSQPNAATPQATAYGSTPNAAPQATPPFQPRVQAPRPAPYNPPRPIRFWQIVLKDLATTVVGVTLFCVLSFLLILGGLLVFANAIGSSVGSSSGYVFEEETISGDDACGKKVVVLPIEGEIETDEQGFIVNALDALRDDDKVCALVLRVNSPGGTISGSDYYLHLLKELKEELSIPIVVSMGDLAASGGYYISTVGDKIFAERSTTTGSIGVIVSMYNAAELCKKIGVRSSAITSGDMKGMGDFMKEPTSEETEIWQNLVNDSYEQFLSVIREGRPYYQAADENESVKSERDAELRKLADGRIYSANAAKELHLIDEIGFLADAVDAAIDAAGADKNNVQVVRYSESEGLLDSIIGAKVKANRLDKVVGALSTPRAYYICPRSLPGAF